MEMEEMGMVEVGMQGVEMEVMEMVEVGMQGVASEVGEMEVEERQVEEMEVGEMPVEEMGAVTKRKKSQLSFQTRVHGQSGVKVNLQSRYRREVRKPPGLLQLGQQ